MQEADVSRNTLIQKVTGFLQTVPPKTTLVIVTVTGDPRIETHDFTAHTSYSLQTETDTVWESPSSLPSTSREIIYETPKHHWIQVKQKRRKRISVTFPKRK